jgi:porphobilinogen synthase
MNDTIQRMIRETTLHANNFVMPFFVRPGTQIKQPIQSMPGQYQWSIDLLVPEVAQLYASGIPAVMLFGIPAHKDTTGSDNYSADGIIPHAIRSAEKGSTRINSNQRFVFL